MSVGAALRIEGTRRIRLLAAVLPLLVTLAAGHCGGSKNPGFGDSQSGEGGVARLPDGAPAGPGLGTSTPGGADASGLGFFTPRDSGADQTASTGNGMPPVVINDCPGSIGTANATALQNASGVNPFSLTWLYPYDKTVFPAAIIAPTLQWSQSNVTEASSGPDAVYVHLHSFAFDYQGCFSGSNPPQIALPQNVYDTAVIQSAGVSDPLTVELSTITGGTVSGPIQETWTFARGKLKGIVYYNTYDSQLASAQISGNSNGAVMSIAPGAAMPSVLLTIDGVYPTGPCISCHSISSNGKYLAAQRHNYLFQGMNLSGLIDSESYDLSSAAMLNPNVDAGAGGGAALAQIDTDDWGFSAMYPDGSRLLTSGQANQTNPPFPASPGNNPGMIGPAASKMFDPRTGAMLTFTGLSAKYAMMPMFSPDGTKIVFNDYDHGNGHSLVVQDFDPATNTFSNPKTIYQDSSSYPGWPFFTPDASLVVFALGDSDNFATVHTPPLQDNAMSDLYVVSVAGNGQAQALDAANGYANGQSYLPYPGRDEHLNFYPTVSPIPSGGYFWIYFTSRRNYGNMQVRDITDADSKKIWITPLEIGDNGLVKSHPAFYLDGQELTSGNIRVFAALEPCKPDGPGQTCTSGIDCCNGYCTDGICGKPPVPRCSNTDEKCTKKSDCCNPLDDCIGGFCEQPRAQ